MGAQQSPASQRRQWETVCPHFGGVCRYLTSKRPLPAHLYLLPSLGTGTLRHKCLVSTTASKPEGEPCLGILNVTKPRADDPLPILQLLVKLRLLFLIYFPTTTVEAAPEPAFSLRHHPPSQASNFADQRTKDNLLSPPRDACRPPPPRDAPRLRGPRRPSQGELPWAPGGSRSLRA